MDHKSWNTPSAHLRGARGSDSYAIMRDSLPVQLHDTILSSKQPVSAHKDSLLSITNHMLSHGSTCLSKINGCFMPVLEKNISILPGVRGKLAAAWRSFMTYDSYSYKLPCCTKTYKKIEFLIRFNAVLITGQNKRMSLAL